MNFKIGDKVKVKQGLLSTLSTPHLIKTLQRIGTVKNTSDKYVEVVFLPSVWYLICKSELELLKNHQYEFDFMT